MTSFSSLGDLVVIKGGGTPSRDNPSFWRGPIPWATVKDLTTPVLSKTQESITFAAVKSSATNVIPAGAIITATRMGLGKAAINTIDVAINQDLKALQPKSSLDSRYLLHFLLSKASHIEAMGKGATVKGILLDDLKQLQIPLPPLTEQKRIAAILDKADAIRRKRQAAIKIADDFLRGIFLDMFGDPVINSKGWDVKPFGDLLISLRYGTGSPPPYQDVGVPFIRATNIKKGTIQTGGMRFISQEDCTKISKCKVFLGDLIIVRSGVNTGDCAIIPKQYDGAYAAYDIIMTLPYEKAVFYNYLINSKFGKQLIEPLTRRAAQPHLNADQIKGMMFIAPPEKMLQKFCQILLKVNEINQRQDVHDRDLFRLFSSLSQRAFRGEL